ncbi:MAG: 16S rRNA (cytidine(1402)-2'-O)-methyltransferase [Candidatus Cloacimonadaceae bacterium]|jgi:16S rRNA (cytidine1402-2'-O)-methyltransferase|nr:16S rRNA (cytidine(1402)-2'-O)-methyltransferase [Candidatus Cloacimonadota bacterium]MCB5255764.1 16S rRNA (cytidine(1402)-2'-O)-methyltransferase [Candidatus Cloacimonadota bacterium]MCK9178608.1 16S rRNA (cytidine(1402)-2'-O)-methyltransferase [Candidatus Cloacimonadota bacterium]MCK9242790.1 16S rRNA (cytidine(1402)-2'-O)-methyltransferase [Candidatus Cloacimonadota bacterium]MDY0126973.1 16S rRNA (cytidine(1402)-2'-O)-methyltransferase [Candidatus Cloacimonadaceae bacterium]
MCKGVIFLVPVPIGNLRDITLRALDTLKAVSLIACEDTRKTSFLLKHYEIAAPKLISFHKFNERSREELLFAHLDQGKDLAVVSDAGSPTISDPAQSLVSAAITRGYEVQALPGATALIPALSISGFPTSAFQFIGFLPSKVKDRTELLKQIKAYTYPTVMYESVHHLKATLQELDAALSPRNIAIAREISKLHEECIRKDIAQILQDYDITEKGEFVIVIEGAQEIQASFPDAAAFRLLEKYNHLKSKELAAIISEKSKVGKNEAYAFVLEHRK